MFSKVSFSFTISCLLFSFALTTSAALGDLGKAGNRISEVPPVRLAYANLNQSNMLGNSYKTAMTMQVINSRDIVDSGHMAGKIEQKPMSKPLLGFACGLVFLGVMKRRLSR